jgi:predicted  nucleic acid-binding Zn-ribbon protein
MSLKSILNQYEVINSEYLNEIFMLKEKLSLMSNNSGEVKSLSELSRRKYSKDYELEDLKSNFEKLQHDHQSLSEKYFKLESEKKNLSRMNESLQNDMTLLSKERNDLKFQLTEHHQKNKDESLNIHNLGTHYFYCCFFCFLYDYYYYLYLYLYYFQSF